MNVYKYDNKTKEYIGTIPAMLDPLESKLQKKDIYLLPANATFTAPPELKKGKTYVWDNEKWKEIEDHRGETYWMPGNSVGTPGHVMNELGPLPDGATITAPEWTLPELKEFKKAEVNAWTAAKITGGFTSEATGETVTYDSDKDTQLTMQGVAATAGTDLFAQKYPDGVAVRGYAQGSSMKQVYTLTAAQVQAWCADLSKHINDCKQAGWAKQAAVQAAESKEELDAISLE